jgi:uncharacterized membrane protein YfcA
MISRRLSLGRDLAVGAGVGAFSGAFGVGGGIQLVPYLVLVRKMAQKNAQATALITVAMGAAAGGITYGLADSVAWLPASIILIGGLLGSLIGSHVVQRISDKRLQIVFGFLLVIVALRLLLSNPATTTSPQELPTITPLIVVAYLASGLAMGTLSALFGIGGGILIIPILVTGFGFEQQLAAGTSLAVMMPIALLGAIRLTKPGLTNWRSGSLFGIASVPGAALGSFIALSLPGEILRSAFALVLVVIAITLVRKGLRA